MRRKASDGKENAEKVVQPRAVEVKRAVEVPGCTLATVGGPLHGTTLSHVGPQSTQPDMTRRAC